MNDLKFKNIEEVESMLKKIRIEKSEDMTEKMWKISVLGFVEKQKDLALP